MVELIQKPIKKLNPDYIAGYVDGEGCFGLQCHSSKWTETYSYGAAGIVAQLRIWYNKK